MKIIILNLDKKVKFSHAPQNFFFSSIQPLYQINDARDNEMFRLNFDCALKGILLKKNIKNRMTNNKVWKFEVNIPIPFVTQTVRAKSPVLYKGSYLC